MAETELVEKSEATISTSACKHSFGFLSQRAKGEATPEECFTCEKMLDCRVTKPEGSPDAAAETVEVKPEPIEESEPELEQELEPTEATEEPEEVVEEAAEEVAEPESEPVVSVEKIEEAPEEENHKFSVDAMPRMIKEQVTKRFAQILRQRIPRKLGVQVEATEPAEETATVNSGGADFCVESAGTLYNLWSGTVILNKETLESFGKKIKEVELETKKGRVMVCKAYGVSELAPHAIQVPTKIQTTLHIEEGAHVKVKPLTK
jgi:hypothetical protein